MTGDGQNLAQRRAALAVHAMAPADREWVLRELPPVQRGLLQPLLAELGELGIPQDAALLREATVAAPTAPAVLVHLRERDVLSAGSARALARWLRGEPPQVGARLLNACPAWRMQLMRALPSTEQRSMATLAASLVPAPELERLVLSAAHRRLLAPAVTSPMSWLRKLAPSLSHREQR